ncbi:syntaxin-22-like protein [Blastocystis sp. subtype 4]|uniref:syntaxin-22-like protein n=1 Tax=Blastocystis sp. subtype 4 TaxID=944170 RepID=UPI000711CA59|nr:syntaxin-22-like protein [Blastocystis sp. subtype 4]KNB45257.1 syntaxin-22-like protein [Blastocystis sp. subtype 4]|eukprot:XP_014528700.1 syntaxin-22-like protein [Blastocystis sp. subtype 4]
MSFRDISAGKTNKTYSPVGNRAVARVRTPDADQLSTSVDDIRFDLKHLDDKLAEFNRMYQNLGTRVDNQQLRTEMRKAIRDLNALQAKLSDHLDEMEQYAKSKSKDRNMLKQLSELRRNKELKAKQIESVITKAQDFMKTNPPQTVNQSAFLDTEEVEDKFNKGDDVRVNPSNANLQYNDLIIRERHEDILALSTEMNQVQTVFRDLATMINDQGEMVEDIESNLTSSAEQSKQGVRQVLVG